MKNFNSIKKARLKVKFNPSLATKWGGGEDD